MQCAARVVADFRFFWSSLSRLVVWVSLHFWTLVCSELALSLYVFSDAEQYCVLLVRSVFLQVLLNGVSGFVLRSAFRIALGRVFFSAFACDVFVSRAVIGCLWSSCSEVLHCCNFLICISLFCAGAWRASLVYVVSSQVEVFFLIYLYSF